MLNLKLLSTCGFIPVSTFHCLERLSCKNGQQKWLFLKKFYTGIDSDGGGKILLLIILFWFFMNME